MTLHSVNAIVLVFIILMASALFICCLEIKSLKEENDYFASLVKDYRKLAEAYADKCDIQDRIIKSQEKKLNVVLGYFGLGSDYERLEREAD